MLFGLREFIRTNRLQQGVLICNVEILDACFITLSYLFLHNKLPSSSLPVSGDQGLRWSTAGKLAFALCFLGLQLENSKLERLISSEGPFVYNLAVDAGHSLCS